MSAYKNCPTLLGRHLTSHRQCFRNFLSAPNHIMDYLSDDEVLAMIALLLYLRKTKRNWTMYMQQWILQRPLKFIVTEISHLYLYALVCFHVYLGRLRNDLYCVEWDVKLYYTIPYHVYLGLQSNNGKCTDHHTNWQNVYPNNSDYLNDIEID